MLTLFLPAAISSFIGSSIHRNGRENTHKVKNKTTTKVAAREMKRPKRLQLLVGEEEKTPEEIMSNLLPSLISTRYMTVVCMVDSAIQA